MTEEWRGAEKINYEQLKEEISEITQSRKKCWEEDVIKSANLKGKIVSDVSLKNKYTLPGRHLTYTINIPEDWEVLSLDAVAWRITYGITVRPKYVENGIPLISAKELRDNVVEVNKASKISNIDYDNLSMKCRIFEGDVLFSKTGTIGRVATYPFKGKAASSQNIAVISPVIDSNYLKYFLMSESIQKLAKSKVKAVAVADLQLGILKLFPVPIPTMKEQRQIVQEIESRLSVCDKLEETITDSLKQAEALRQSILKKAFDGGLK